MTRSGTKILRNGKELLRCIGTKRLGWAMVAFGALCGYLGLDDGKGFVAKEQPVVVWAEGKYKATGFSGLNKFYATQNQPRFIDNRDGTIMDTKTKLMWIKNGRRLDFISAVTWWDAIKKCDNFKFKGYTDWRLPTIIEEWRSVIDKKKQRPSLVEPNAFENMIVHMPYWSKTEFIYGKEYTCTTVCPIRAYTVTLWFGNIAHRNKRDMAFVLPVRSID